MTRVLEQDHNLRTELPASLKAKITQHEAAIRELAFQGAAAPEDRQAILEHARHTRYELERTILTHIERAGS